MLGCLKLSKTKQPRPGYKNDIEQLLPRLKDNFLPSLWASYTMSAALLKMDHPCFLNFFRSNRADDGFRPRGGLFCPFRSADIGAGPRDDFGAGRTADTCRYSKPGPENSTGKYKMRHRTIGIGVEVITKRNIPPVLQTSGGCGRKESICGASGCLRLL